MRRRASRAPDARAVTRDARSHLGSPPTSRCLEQSDHVAVCVFHCWDQFAATDVSYRLLRLCACVDEVLEALVDVVNVPVADRPGHASAVAVGVETHLLACDVEPHL